MAKTEQIAEYIHELKEGYIILDMEKTAPAQKEALLQEYQWQKLLAETRPDNKVIQVHLKQLEKERWGRLSPLEYLARRRSENALDTFTERDFQGIIKGLMHEQAQALIKLREREREREIERGR